MTGPTRRGRRAPVVTPPVSLGVLATLVVIGVFAIALLEFNALSYAYRRIGVSVHWMLVILAVALLCSAVNIPVATLHSRVVEGSAVVRVFGVPTGSRPASARAPPSSRSTSAVRSSLVRSPAI